MGGKERSYDDKEGAIIEMTALFLAGRVKKEDLDENNTQVLEYYLGVITSGEDKKLAAMVHARQKEIMNSQTTVGARTQIFNEEDLKNTKRHPSRSREVRREALPPSLFAEETPSDLGVQITETNFDPEREVMKFGAKMDKPSFRSKKSLMAKDVGHEKEDLRDKIGLPIARGNDPHVNDRLYQYLVKKVCMYDIFQIVAEYDRASCSGEIPQQLSKKIADVRQILKTVFDSGLTHPRGVSLFNKLANECVENWNK